MITPHERAAEDQHEEQHQQRHDQHEAEMFLEPSPVWHQAPTR